ncbi:MAG: hypothetical protein EXX96DRAFT_103711 [Benjaminiella poitrasii]|nr:MAG: hypothetical protein EXX96DRAFT_103711 [Benjaminiella poitrasii]
MDIAVDLMKDNINSIQDEIEKELKKIEIKQQEIISYEQELSLMQSQLDTFHYSLTTSRDILLRDMTGMREGSLAENEMTIKLNKKRYHVQRHRLLKYYNKNNSVSGNIEIRLFELEKKIKAVWRRDEIWAGIRDWGFLSILLFLLIIATFLAWKS